MSVPRVNGANPVPTPYAPVMELSAALEAVWVMLAQRFPELPQVVISAPERGRRVVTCSADWSASPVHLAIDPATQRAGSLARLDWVTHGAAHGLAVSRTGPSRGSSGRWHSTEFKSAAEQLGLEVEHAGESAGTGWSITRLPIVVTLAGALDTLGLVRP